MERNGEAVMDVMFAADAKTWEKHFYPLGGLENFVENDCRQEVAAWFPPELQKRHLETFGRKGGCRGPSNYYTMKAHNLSIPDEEEYHDFKISHPTILVLPSEPATVTTMQQQMLSEWARNLKLKTVDAGHWVHMKKAIETNEAIEKLLQGL